MSQNHKLKLEPKFEIFGSYILLKKIAEGGMAEVFLARPSSYMGNGRLLVVKRLLPHFSNQPMFLNMFQNEIQVLMGFCHPNTVQLHDFGKVEDQPFIAMEFLNGKNLRDLSNKMLLKKGEMIPVPVVLSLIIQAAAGLDYAHTFMNSVTGETANTIHRDVSPQNLIVSYEGNLKVIDFGIAKANTNLDEKTRIGTIKGKAAYLSPEQTRGEVVDARSDIFSLGIVAWELLTLIRYYNQKDSDRKKSGHNVIGIRDNTVSPSIYNDKVPVDLDIAIAKALRINANDRYQTAKEFQSALRQIMLKYFPNHTYADTGTFVRDLFTDEIEKEKTEVFELNREAQQALFKQDTTVIVPAPSQLTPTEGIVEKDDKDEFIHTRIAVLEGMIKMMETTTRVASRLPKGEVDGASFDPSSETWLAQEHFNSLLADNLDIDTTQILKIRDNTKVRVMVEGRINIYDINGKIITKAKLRNCCLSGIGFETAPSTLAPQTPVLVEFNAEGFGPKMGLVKCEVRWVAPIEGHYWGHHVGGLQFTKLTPESTKKLSDYLKNYKRSDGFGIDDR
ncbi:MAG: serine/threonine protein kinase [Bdellovibrionaceae bacterium]|nr:serine/threonine protein kinase [Pseudobdellovibrionaceae bacterium]